MVIFATVQGYRSITFGFKLFSVNRRLKITVFKTENLVPWQIYIIKLVYTFI